MNSTKYFSVGINGTWTTEAVAASFFEERGGVVRDSRIDSEFEAGIKTLWVDGMVAGKLFPSRSAQIAHLREKGLIHA